MVLRKWPERDEKWVARYRTSIVGKHVPSAAIEVRERELLEAVRASGLPATDLFGDAAVLAAEDVAELATAEEAVRTSEGGGLRPALREVGRMLIGLASVTVIFTLVRSGWSVDVDSARLLVGASLAIVFVGWAVGRTLFSAGLPAAMVGVLVPAGAVAVAGIVWAASIGPGRVLASEAPVLLLGVGLLAPGVVALVVASRMAPTSLREDWDDDEWLHRFRGGLRSRLVPAAIVRGHVGEVQQASASGASSAYLEFGHPLVLAHELAEADRTARARRWWVAVVVGAGTSLALAAVVAVLALETGGDIVTVSIVVILVLGAVTTLVVGWGDRPWRGAR